MLARNHFGGGIGNNSEFHICTPFLFFAKILRASGLSLNSALAGKIPLKNKKCRLLTAVTYISTKVGLRFLKVVSLVIPIDGKSSVISFNPQPT